MGVLSLSFAFLELHPTILSMDLLRLLTQNLSIRKLKEIIKYD
jgi:hypothetical protein